MVPALTVSKSLEVDSGAPIWPPPVKMKVTTKVWPLVAPILTWPKLATA